MAKIIVAEDSIVFRDILVDLLNTVGHEVLAADHGAHALELLEQHPADVLITDYIMPEMDGEELLRKVRERGITCKAIVMSGGADVKGLDFKHLFDGLDVWRYIDKPFKVQELIAVLQELPTESEV